MKIIKPGDLNRVVNDLTQVGPTMLFPTKMSTSFILTNEEAVKRIVSGTPVIVLSVIKDVGVYVLTPGGIGTIAGSRLEMMPT